MSIACGPVWQNEQTTRIFLSSVKSFLHYLMDTLERGGPTYLWATALLLYINCVVDTGRALSCCRSCTMQARPTLLPGPGKKLGPVRPDKAMPLERMLGPQPHPHGKHFRFNKFFASKRNEAKRDPFRMCFARSGENYFFFFASFRFFSLRIFRFQPMRNKYTVFSLCFASKNFSFRFILLLISETFFALFCFEAKRNKHLFRFFSLH